MCSIQKSLIVGSCDCFEADLCFSDNSLRLFVSSSLSHDQAFVKIALIQNRGFYARNLSHLILFWHVSYEEANCPLQYGLPKFSSLILALAIHSKYA